MTSLNKTFLPNRTYRNRTWFTIDCKGQKVGRLATIIVNILKGKKKPYYYPSIDVGDFVILLNAEAIIVNKSSKHYLVNKPGRPGRALKIKRAVDSIPKLTIERAVKGMLSKTETKKLMRRLMIYNDKNHSHIAQNPLEINLLNIKNGKIVL